MGIQILLTDQESYIKLLYVVDCLTWVDIEQYFINNGQQEVLGGNIVNVTDYDRVVLEVYGEQISGDDLDMDVVSCPVNEVLDYLD